MRSPRLRGARIRYRSGVDLEAAVDLLAELVAIDTTSSRSNLPLVERLADRLASAAEDVRLFRSPDGAKANLWARFGPEPDAARRGLILSGHTDVVPAPREGWESDPFRLADRGDRWVAQLHPSRVALQHRARSG